MKLDVKSHPRTLQATFFDTVSMSTTLSYMGNICLMTKLMTCQQVVLGDLDIHVQRMKLDSYLIPHMKQCKTDQGATGVS